MNPSAKDVEQRFAAYLNQVEATGSLFLPLYPPARLMVAATEDGLRDESNVKELFDGAIV